VAMRRYFGRRVANTDTVVLQCSWECRSSGAGDLPWGFSGYDYTPGAGLGCPDHRIAHRMPPLQRTAASVPGKNEPPQEVEADSPALQGGEKIKLIPECPGNDTSACADHHRRSQSQEIASV
jgi:hypothetical protein